MRLSPFTPPVTQNEHSNKQQVPSSFIGYRSLMIEYSHTQGVMKLSD